MRTYPRNSPQAAARIVALVLTSDGHVCSSEERALDKLDIAGQLGLAPEQFARIVQALYEDHSVAHAPHTPMATLMSEIDSPALQRKVMRLCVAAASADDYLADGEITLLAAVFTAWGPAPAVAKVRHDTPRAVLHAHARVASTT
jgi:transposase-like protein